MPAWGLPGGGPMTEQQIHQLIVYLRTIQLDSEEIASQVTSGLRDGARKIVTKLNPEITNPEAIEAEIDSWLSRASDPTSSDYLTYGELIFNNNAAQGANSCARCHTPGYSYGATDEVSTAELIATWPRLEDSGILTGYRPGAGHVGPSLSGVKTHFATETQQANFIRSGSEVGVGYGNARVGTGGMPGFGARTDELDVVGTVVRSQILTTEQIEAVVAYERTLG